MRSNLHQTFRVGILCLAAITFLAESAAAQTGVTIALNGAGLSSLQYGGAQFLGDGDFRVNGVLLQSGASTPFNGDLTASVQMDIPSQTLTRTYGWGTVAVNYAAFGNKLTLTITTTNKSSNTIKGLFYEPLALKFPGAVQEYDGVDPMLGDNISGPTLMSMSYGSGVMVLDNEDVSKPLELGLPWSWDKPANTFFPLRANTDKDGMYPSFFPTINRPIPPGGSDQYQISLRFGPPGSTLMSLASDIYSKFAAAFPQTLNWPDRRAVGALFLATSATGWPKNPRGWLQDATVDVTTPAGIAALQARVLTYADTSISYLKSMNAQGMVTWDIEGEQFPHATTYACDPRQLATLAPEIDSVADAYFKKFRDAGLKVGVCVRPQNLVVAPDLSSASQLDVADPASLMISKIQYAVNRWGVSIVYVDSNGGPNDPMDPAIFRQVAAAFPNVVLMPEHKNLKYYAYTAPGLGLRDGYAGTPSLVKFVYPNAFSFVYTADGPISQRFNDLVASVKQGDVLMYRSWFDDEPANSLVKSIYQTAGTAPPPPAVSITSPASGVTVSGTTTIAATATGAAGIAGVQFKADGNNIGSQSITSPYSASWNTASVANGTHSLTATVTDAAGATAISTGVTVTVNNSVPDTTPPAVSVTAPASGATVFGSITISASASDNVGVAGVRFSVDGVKLGAELATSPYTIGMNTALFTNGSHSISAVARDTSNNTSTASLSVTVNNTAPDTTPPSVSINSPASGATLSGTITVSAAATDNVGVAGVQFTVDGTKIGTELTAAPYTVSFNTATVADGNHTFTATARDAAGNTAAASSTVAIKNAVPVLSCNTPGNNSFTGCYYTDRAWTNLAVVRTDPAINFDWGFSATPDPSISHYDFSVRWSGNFTFAAGTYQFSLSTDDGSVLYVDGQVVINYWGEHPAIPVTATLTLTSGSHLVRLDYYQISGRASAALSWTQVGGAPATPPTTSITSPAAGSTVSGTVMLSANATDAAGIASVTFQVDNNGIGTGIGAGPYTLTLNTSTLTNGTHTLTALARNTAGLVGTSAPVSFTVNNSAATPPSVTVNAGPNSTVSGTLTLTASATDAAGIASVQFQEDGVNIGGALTAPPYSLTFDTTTSTNGTHTFGAMARNLSGLTTTSAPATLTINNAIAPLPACNGVGTNNFFGCYFSDMGWGKLVYTRTDGQIAFNWGYNGPGGGLAPDVFSVRWQGNFAFTGGSYQFSDASDDGSIVYLDGQPILNYWGQHPAIPLTVTVQVTQGTHLVRVDYYNQGGQSIANVSWNKVN